MSPKLWTDRRRQAGGRLALNLSPHRPGFNKTDSAAEEGTRSQHRASPGAEGPHAAAGYWVQGKPGFCPAAGGGGLCGTQSGRGGTGTHTAPALASGSLEGCSMPRSRPRGGQTRTAGLPSPGSRDGPPEGHPTRTTLSLKCREQADVFLENTNSAHKHFPRPQRCLPLCV